ncbi:general substrate transporter [Dipodascopsis tothii]|uniref:general substrate transporter n=1 Tax=Dipodascopsis tothii TaxID=44089 RepID=UPI0034CE158D
MAGGHTGGVTATMPVEISQRRERLAGKGGFAGILENVRLFLTVFTVSLGALLYGYNQGMFSQILTMNSFKREVEYSSIANPMVKGMMTSILELGAWFGALCTGYMADKLGRKHSIYVAVVVFLAGVIVQASSHGDGKPYFYSGRFIVGLGVGSLSMIVPLYTAELAPAEIRGALVGLQGTCICAGVAVAYWIGFGTQFIGGTGVNQSRAAWLIPTCIQVVPALMLGVGVMFMHQSPRWLMDKGRQEECLDTIATIRGKSISHEAVILEFLEIKAQYLFEQETKKEWFPQYQDGTRKSACLLTLHNYLKLFSTISMLRRTSAAVLVMLFQQWTGITAILYYAPTIFQSLGLTSNTVSVLATGVVGILQVLPTIPVSILIDKLGRRPLLIWGGFGMAACHYTIAGISGAFEDDWSTHNSAAWACVVMVWLYIVVYAFSWCNIAWILVSEVFPLGLRAKGVALGVSSNWLNNFAIGLATPTILESCRYGTYLFFGSMSFLAAVWVYFLVPETKGRSLEEMDELFYDTSGQSKLDMERQIRIWSDLGMLDEELPDIEKVREFGIFDADKPSTKHVDDVEKV